MSTGADSATRCEPAPPLSSVRRKNFWKYRMTCLVWYFVSSPETFSACFDTAALGSYVSPLLILILVRNDEQL